MIYEVFDEDGKSIFIGTSNEIKEKFDVAGPITQYALYGYKLKRKYTIRQISAIIAKYELTDENGNVVFCGTTKEVNEHFHIKKDTRINNYANQKMRFLKKYTVRKIVENVLLSGDYKDAKTKEKAVSKARKNKEDDDYGWIKFHIIRDGITGYHKDRAEEMLKRLEADGYKCFLTPSQFDKKWMVIRREW